MIKDWIEAMRPRTLPVSVAGVITAIGYACFYGTFKVIPAILCITFALLAQIVSNFANEYYDFKRGADKKGRVGPRRSVTEGSITPTAMRNVTYATLVIACAIGCCLIPYGGVWLIGVGIIIALFAIAYSAGPYPLSRKGLGDIAVLLFFGIVPVMFTFYVQSGYFTTIVFLASLTIGILAINVLLVNNYRDYDDDKAVGKRTTVVIFGRRAAAVAYLCNGYIAMMLIAPICCASRQWYLWLIPIIVYLPLHITTWNKLRTLNGSALNPILGQTARNMLIFALIQFIILMIQ